MTSTPSIILYGLRIPLLRYPYTNSFTHNFQSHFLLPSSTLSLTLDLLVDTPDGCFVIHIRGLMFGVMIIVREQPKLTQLECHCITKYLKLKKERKFWYIPLVREVLCVLHRLGETRFSAEYPSNGSRTNP